MENNSNEINQFKDYLAPRYTPKFVKPNKISSCNLIKQNDQTNHQLNSYLQIPFNNINNLLTTDPNINISPALSSLNFNNFNKGEALIKQRMIYQPPNINVLNCANELKGNKVIQPIGKLSFNNKLYYNQLPYEYNEYVKNTINNSKKQYSNDKNIPFRNRQLTEKPLTYSKFKQPVSYDKWSEFMNYK